MEVFALEEDYFFAQRNLSQYISKQSIYLSMYVIVYLSIYLSVYLSIYLSMY